MFWPCRCGSFQAAVCDRGLEGVVAKRLRDPYRPGERGWVKTKNRSTKRFAEELAGAAPA
jgi:ATP-dependent DNA ligase